MIRSINLDSLFVPTTFPEIEYSLFQFSGGEWHIKLNNLIDYSRVVIRPDSGLKKSAKGLLQVKNSILKDQCTWEEEQNSDLQTVFKDGVLIKEFTLEEVRNTLNNE